MMRKVTYMLLKIALAIIDSNQKQELARRLVGLSMVLKYEFDISEYTYEYELLLNNTKNIDILFMDYEYLKRYRDKLSEIYVSNNKCLPVFLGTPTEKICDFLVIRPIEYIENAVSVEPEDENGKIKRLCDIIISNIKHNFEKKIDNSIIYVTTKQESFALRKESIVYCQSDLKYTLFIIDDGRIIRKLEKLQDVEDKFLWDFERIHQSFLVNPQKVIGVDKASKEMILEGNLRVPISRKYSAQAKKIVENVN